MLLRVQLMLRRFSSYAELAGRPPGAERFTPGREWWFAAPLALDWKRRPGTAPRARSRGDAVAGGGSRGGVVKGGVEDVAEGVEVGAGAVGREEPKGMRAKRRSAHAVARNGWGAMRAALDGVGLYGECRGLHPATPVDFAERERLNTHV
jgi:hypothetical protein